MGGKVKTMNEDSGLLDTFERFRQVLLTNDAQALDDLMAEEFIAYGPCGTLQDRRISIDAYRPGQTRLDTFTTSEVSTRVIDSVGIISGRGYIHGFFGEHEFEHDLRFIDLYRMRDGKWQLFLSQVTPITQPG